MKWFGKQLHNTSKSILERFAHLELELLEDRSLLSGVAPLPGGISSILIHPLPPIQILPPDSGNDNGSPVDGTVAVANPGDQANSEGDTVALEVTATDPNGLPLTFSADGLPDGLSIDPQSGLIFGTINAGAATASPYLTTITASDGTSSDEQSFNWTVSPADNFSSGVTVFPIDDQYNTEGDQVSLLVTATSPSNLPLTFSADGLPDGLSIDSQSGLISGTIAAGAANAGPYTTTVTASDGTSSDNQTFVWNVFSGASFTAGVSITPIPDQQNAEGDQVSLQVNATNANSLPLSYSADGLPDGLSIDSQSGLISGTIAAGAANDGPYLTTVTATDGSSTDVQFFNWNVTSAVSIPPIADQSNTEGDQVSLQVTATDQNNLPLTYSADSLPDGLSIDPQSGLISGTIAAGAANDGPYWTMVTATDGSSSNTQSFTWNVASAISIPSIADQSNTEGDQVSLQVTATDLNNLPLTYSADSLPDGLSIDPQSGLISGTIVAGAANDGPYWTTVTATDGSSSNTQSFTWNVASAISISSIADQSNIEGDQVSLQVTATDLNNLPLTFSADSLPDGLSIDPQRGLISGTIVAGAANDGPYWTTVTATDGSSSNTQSFTWNVASAISITPIADPSNIEGDQVSLQVTATDLNNLPLTYSADSLPDGLSIDPQSGLISGTIALGAANSGPYWTTVTVTDGTSTNTQAFTWNVASVVSIAPIPDQFNSEGDPVSLQVTATDLNNLPLTYSATGLPAGLSIDPQSGLISGTIAAGAASTGDFGNGFSVPGGPLWAKINFWTSLPSQTTITATDGTSTASVSFNWNISSGACIPVDFPIPTPIDFSWWRKADGVPSFFGVVNPPSFLLSPPAPLGSLSSTDGVSVPVDDTAVGNPAPFDPTTGGSSIAAAVPDSTTPATNDLGSPPPADQPLNSTVAAVVNSGRLQQTGTTGDGSSSGSNGSNGPGIPPALTNGQSDSTDTPTAPLPGSDSLADAGTQGTSDPNGDWNPLKDANDQTLS